MSELVQVAASCECRSLGAAKVRAAVRLTLEAAASRTGRALATMAGTE